MEEIKELDTWNMSDTVYTQDGWDRKELPEATAKNMALFMDKINELSKAVNLLLERNHLIEKKNENED